jgi:DNA-binding response OmpR family regulator
MQGKMVLVADDEPNILRSIKLVLEEEGYQVLTATDGEETLNISLSEKIDLIILDLKLPKLSGLDVYRSLKDNKRSALIPIIILTALGQEVAKREGWDLSPADYITKPFSPYDIVERVNRILGN